MSSNDMQQRRTTDPGSVLYVNNMGKDFWGNVPESTPDRPQSNPELLQSTMQRDRDSFRTIFADTEDLPENPDESHIIIGGSLDSVNDEVDNTWIKNLIEFIQRMREQNKYILGICFGHQAVVKAFGGEVEKGKFPEFGIPTLDLSEDALDDPLFDGMGGSFPVIQTHGDVVIKGPEGNDVRNLASTRFYNNQSFAIGERIRTVQFHPEMNRRQMYDLAIFQYKYLVENRFDNNAVKFQHFLSRILTSSDLNSPINTRLLHNFYRMGM